MGILNKIPTPELVRELTDRLETLKKQTTDECEHSFAVLRDTIIEYIGIAGEGVDYVEF